MKPILNFQVFIALFVISLAAIIAAAAYTVDAQSKKFTQELAQNIEAQRQVLTKLAEHADRNTPDEIVAGVILDCAERTKFEGLLDRLGTLDHKELLTAQQLFDSCGGFYSEIKGFMVARLQREQEIFSEYVTLATLLGDDPALRTEEGKWNALVTMEQERSALLNEQVLIQGSIITALIKGERVNSTNVSSSIKRAQSIGEELQVLDKRVDALRLEVTS